MSADRPVHSRPDASIYAESRPLLDPIHPRSRASLWALIAIYSRLLERIERSNYDVFRRRVRLPLWEKSWAREISVRPATPRCGGGHARSRRQS